MLIHSPGPDVTRVHSHRDKLSNKLSTNANKTLDSFATSFIWIKHLTASSPALSERNKVSCFILIWWGPVLQWILELTDVVKTGSFDVHDFCCQPQFSAFVCFCHESEIARQLGRKASCGWTHGIHYLPYSCLLKWSRNCPKVVRKLFQICPKVDWTDRLAADGRLVSTTCLPVDTQVRWLEWTHANTLRYNWKVDKHNNN